MNADQARRWLAYKAMMARLRLVAAQKKVWPHEFTCEQVGDSLILKRKGAIVVIGSTTTRFCYMPVAN